MINVNYEPFDTQIMSATFPLNLGIDLRYKSTF